MVEDTIKSKVYTRKKWSKIRSNQRCIQERNGRRYDQIKGVTRSRKCDSKRIDNTTAKRKWTLKTIQLIKEKL
jgi:hypothetical protein